MPQRDGVNVALTQSAKRDALVTIACTTERKVSQRDASCRAVIARGLPPPTPARGKQSTQNVQPPPPNNNRQFPRMHPTTSPMRAPTKKPHHPAPKFPHSTAVVRVSTPGKNLSQPRHLAHKISKNQVIHTSRPRASSRRRMMGGSAVKVGCRPRSHTPLLLLSPGVARILSAVSDAESDFCGHEGNIAGAGEHRVRERASEGRLQGQDRERHHTTRMYDYPAQQ